MTSKQTASRSAAEWRGLVQEWERSGKTREAFAASRGLVVGTLGWWIGKIRRLDRPTARVAPVPAAATFLPVVVTRREAPPMAPVTPDDRGVEVVLTSGDRVRVPAGVNAVWAGELVAALRGSSRC